MAENYRNTNEKPLARQQHVQASVPPTQHIKTCKDIAREARSANMWVYDPSTKTWYNPEDFFQQYGRVATGYEKFLEQVQIKDPLEGIKAGYQRLIDLQVKLEAFTKRVVEHQRAKK